MLTCPPRGCRRRSEREDGKRGNPSETSMDHPQDSALGRLTSNQLTNVNHPIQDIQGAILIFVNHKKVQYGAIPL